MRETNPPQDKGKKKGFVRNVLVIASSTGVSQAIAVLSSPILLRIYAPDDYGVWTVLMSFSFLFTVLACFRYDLAIVLPESDKGAAPILRLCLIITIIMAVFTLLVTVFLRFSISEAIGEARLAPWLLVAPLILLFTGWLLIGTNWAIRTQHFSWMAWARISQTLTTQTTQIVLGLLFSGAVAGLILGTLAGLALGVVVIATPILFRHGGVLLQSYSKKELIDVAKTHRRFPLYVAPYGFVGVFRDRMAHIMLATMASTTTLGLFALGRKLLYMPIGLVTHSVSPVFFERAAKAEDVATLGPFVVRVLRTLSLLVMPISVLIAFLGPDVFSFVFGERWEKAGTYAAVLCAPSMALLLTSWLDRTFDVLGKQRLALLLDIGFTIAGLSSLYFGLNYLPSPGWAIGLYAAVETSYNMIWLIVVFVIARFSALKLWSVLATALASGLGSFVILFGLTKIFGLIMGGILFIAVLFPYLFYVLRRLRSERNQE